MISLIKHKGINMKKSVKEMIRMDSGDYLFKDYGKYCSNLSIIISKDLVDSEGNFEFWKSCPSHDLNLDEGQFEKVQGDFFVSKKGTKIFKIKNNGKHLLVRDNWGGCFNNYRGGTLPENQLYFRRASSNGGGSGYDYAVIPLDWKYTISEDDL